jgi:hypothetical protein
MKKYIQPTMDTIEVDTLDVIATSLSIYDTAKEEQLIGRQRTESWTGEDR